MHVVTVKTGPFETNTYLLWNEPENTVIIDPGADAPRIAAQLKKAGAKPVKILLTHGHADHLSALDELLSEYPEIRVGMSSRDSVWAFSSVNTFPMYETAQHFPSEKLDFLKEGDTVKAGTLVLKVTESPGHTPGGLCFTVETAAAVFTGDTLFCGSVGRTDLPGGNADALSASLAKLMKYNDAVKVYPGHGEPSLIGTERMENPYCGGF